MRPCAPRGVFIYYCSCPVCTAGCQMSVPCQWRNRPMTCTNRPASVQSLPPSDTGVQPLIRRNYPLSNLVHTISDPKGTHMSCLQRCIKTHLYPVAFIGMCNFSHCICVFIFLFYFYCILCYRLYQLSACTSVTCILKDQSINQSINDDRHVVSLSPLNLHRIQWTRFTLFFYSCHVLLFSKFSSFSQSFSKIKYVT